MLNIDFTLKKYIELCQAIVSSEYIPLTVHEYLTQNHPDKCIILRHDVDRKPDRALNMAQLEYDYGISSTYYFRTVKEVLQPAMIKQIAELGHEIGYHYEVLDKAKGDITEAIELFEQELKELRKIADITTICMHGNPLTSWVNRDIWKEHNFNDFGIIGEAYLSIDYTKVSYFTDTGRSWNSSKYSIKDVVQTDIYNGKIKSTDELIGLIKNGSQRNICILMHPNRWTDNLGAWFTELVWQNIKNLGKTVIKNRK
jgi:predicted DNA-binding transcriptional regulator